MPRLDYVTTARSPDDLQQPVAVNDVLAMCVRAFPSARPTAIREFDGGEFNTTYKISLAGTEGNDDHIVLRVAPRDAATMSRNERLLMRKAHNAQPYLAPIAPLIPRTIMTDFTRHIVDRDYIFQSFVEGELWSEARGDLSDAQDAALWTQMGGIARSIHAVRGEAFGEPYPGTRFPTWSQAILHNLADIVADATDYGLDTWDLRAIMDRAHAHCNVLDEVTEPRLLHGDLWPFNILIRREDAGARIVAVLDADYAWWGDPLADWTMHLLRIKDASRPRDARGHALFWQEYGRPPQTEGARLRQQLYEGMYAGTDLVWAARNKRKDVLDDVYARLPGIALSLWSSKP